ncbi:MAG TPA: glycosyltransferase family 2 protein, partial [Actinomycetota bacterium]
MAQLETGVPTAAARQGTTAPSVLVILVTRDGATWLPQCLTALSRQTHPRLGVLAIDNGSSDASAEVLESALGADRVIRRSGQGGFAGALAEALRSDIAGQADYALFLHDDTLLGPEAVGAMVEAAERIERVGVVGPKVLDWEQPRVLREIGLSTDRFGYPYSPLEDGEIDQGQYDRIREVLYVSSCAMLVGRRVLVRIGLPDERLAPSQEDMDFCWRARLAGFRVLMTPRAEAVHRGATVRGEREGAADRSRIRYDRERAALAGILKNYGLLTLAW